MKAIALNNKEKTINILLTADRGNSRTSWLDSKHSFSFGDYYDPQNTHFGALRVINDDVVKPASGFGQHSHNDMEIITYVIAGELEHKDSMGNGSVIRPGSVQRMSAGTGVVHSEWNHSKTNPVHFLQIWVFPNKKGLQPSYEEKHHSEDNDGNWRILASSRPSPTGVTLNQDLVLSHAHLSASLKLWQTIEPGRMAWLHVISGSSEVNGKRLSSGDGAAIKDPGKYELSAVSEDGDTRILWFDLENA
jgi:quercetin 2,3-dioxygenase